MPLADNLIMVLKAYPRHLIDDAVHSEMSINETKHYLKRWIDRSTPGIRYTLLPYNSWSV